MAQRADDLIDRRRLRRKLTFWRALTIIVILLAIGGIAAWFGGDGTGSGSHIAKVRITGTITQDDKLLERLEKIRKSPRVAGVIVQIDSPGGTTTGGESIYEAVRKIAAEKPVVAEVGTLAASAGYMIASATDHIVARQSSIVGSIGVLIQYPDVTGLMDKIGIKLEEVKSSPLKASPSPFKPTNEEERAMVRRLIMDSYDWFVDIVANRRSMTREQALALADGSIFTGRQGLQNKLVDALGGEEEAVAWLESQGVAPDLKVIEWKPKEGTASLLLSQSLVRNIARALGLPEQSGDVVRELGMERLFLDGLVSVWHP
ncbi:signal peptide peptidase SppA [Aquamicrobium sp. NLF2-7]|jgi:protease-4|uniref:signal peptide peptidase SppA n=1 Tax=unclassified Aquamicrobium TaxID=2618194 RepID=UPI001EFC0693|nr:MULTISPECIES: signal peptide peptidase SppA [unclassified Aquamicrobium]MCG8271356.1 signal peptide peptidase SppA [Aquamicrobium sp. NLF2-7]MCK9552396.1 signal peptide peptidase SppA [Aquamicrobium sp.]